MYFKHRTSGRKIHKGGFDFEKSYRIIGELGYRKNIWKYYEQRKKEWEERDKEQEIYEQNKRECEECYQKHLSNSINNQWSQPQNQQNQKPDQEQSSSKPTPTPLSQNPPPTTKPAKEDKEVPASTQAQPNKPTNNSPNPLSSSTDIKHHYNSDQAKAEIDSNPNLTTPEQKEQANQLLKLIITAELLVKEQKFNTQTLAQLIKEKKNKQTLYQLLNKESRVDKVIQQLESIQQSQKDNKQSVNNNQTPNQVPTGLIIGGLSLILVVGLGIMMVMRRSMSKKKMSH